MVKNISYVEDNIKMTKKNKYRISYYVGSQFNKRDIADFSIYAALATFRFEFPDVQVDSVFRVD